MQPIVSQEHRKLVVPYDTALQNLIPSSKRIEHPKKGPLLAVPHNVVETKLLRNMGYEAPAPILYYYDWAGHETTSEPPMPVQKTTASLMSMQTRAYILNDMGTGKTRAALYAADFLMREGRINKALIVAPLSTLDVVWKHEINKYFWGRQCAVIHGTRKKRFDLLAEDFDFYIINHDGIHIIKEVLKQRPDIDCVIIDELASFRNQRTRRWKAMQQVSSAMPFVWGLTGTPTPNEPSDAWAQCRLITPDTVPRYYKQFKNMTMRQVSQFKWIDKPDANVTVLEAMQPAVRYKRDDCVKLPPVSYTDREPAMSPVQTKFYSEIMKKLHIQFKGGEITAANEAVKLGKLLQVCCGLVYTNDKGVVELGPAERIRETINCIAASPSKTIVFVPYRHAIKYVRKSLTSAGFQTVSIHGGVSKNKREEHFNAFQDPNSGIQVLIAHPKCMAHGVTLTAAATIVWFGPCPSLELYEQANARITRPPQQHKQLIVHLQSTPIEKRAYKRLRNKSKMQGLLLDMFEETNNG